MEADPLSIGKILNPSVQYIIPLFQRDYSWRKEQWQRLRNDVWGLMEGVDAESHFLGPLVCTPGEHAPGKVPEYHIIDGQQRLTTLTLLLLAMREVASKAGVTELVEEISERYLVDKFKKGFERYKLVPRLGDRELLMALVDRKPLPEDTDAGIVMAYRFFLRHIRHLARKDAEASLRKLLAVVSDQLYLVVITIDGENPYEIFESLNSTGLPLEESDLIRNFVFMQIPRKDQADFHEEHWKPFEDQFDVFGEKSGEIMTAFYRNFLMQGGQYCREDATFVEFKSRVTSEGISMEQLVKRLSYAAGFELMVRMPETCKIKAIQDVLTELTAFDVATAYPLVIRLLEMHDRKKLDTPTLIQCLTDFTSFLLRRAVCGESTRGYGTMFVEAIRRIRKNPVEELRGYWLQRGWPVDETFRDRLLEFPLYRREYKKGLHVLRRLEQDFGHKEHVNLDPLTVEHIMPQTVKGGGGAAAWRKMLGEEWKEVHAEYVHTLGNLTLTGYNSELGNRSFDKKKKAYRESHLELNTYFRSAETWDKDAILERGRSLAKKIAKLWPAPDQKGRAVPIVRLEGLSVAQKRRYQYWEQFEQVMRERGNEIPLSEASAQTTFVFPVFENTNITLWAWQNVPNHRLVVGFSFKGPEKKRTLKVLIKDREEIDREMGVPLDWADTYGDRCVSIFDENIDFRDTEDWHIQHDWLADRIEEFVEVLVPRIQKIQAESKVPSTDTKEPGEGAKLRNEFWKAFSEELERQDSPFPVTIYEASNWITTPTGCGGTAIALVLNSGKNDRVGVTLNFWGKNCKNRYAKTLDKKDEVEKALGQEILWDPLDMKKKKSRDIRLWREDMNPADRENWSEQHQWLIDTTQRFLEIFKPILDILKETPKVKKTGELTARQKRHLAYWTACMQLVEERKGLLSPRKPLAKPEVVFPLGINGCGVVCKVHTDKHELVAICFFRREDGKAIYEGLERDKERIETEFGEPLLWDPMPGKLEYRVKLILNDIDVKKESDWPVQHAWIVDRLEKLYKVFAPRVEKLANV